MADSRKYNILNCKINDGSHRYRCRATHISGSLDRTRPVIKLSFLNGGDGTIDSDEIYIFNGENIGGDYANRNFLRSKLRGIQREFIEKRLSVDEFKESFDSVLRKYYWDKIIVV